MNWILSQDVAGASTLLSSSSQTLLSQSSEDPAGLNLPPSPFPSSYKYKSVFFQVSRASLLIQDSIKFLSPSRLT